MLHQGELGALIPSVHATSMRGKHRSLLVIDILRINHGIETSIPQGPASLEIYHKMITTFVFKGVTVPLSLCRPNIEYKVYIADKYRIQI